jgi:hypothetical protein
VCVAAGQTHRTAPTRVAAERDHPVAWGEPAARAGRDHLARRLVAQRIRPVAVPKVPLGVRMVLVAHRCYKYSYQGVVVADDGHRSFDDCDLSWLAQRDYFHPKVFQSC